MGKNSFIPALRFKVLTPVYDWALARFMREREIKTALISAAHLKPGLRVLDFGCGTGTLLAMMGQSEPKVELHGVDIDPDVLEVAKNKIARANGSAFLHEYDGGQLPFSDQYFDRVVSSLVFHHLTPETKGAALEEIYRVLKPGGELLILDFGIPRGRWQRMLAPVLTRVEPISDNIEGKIPRYMQGARFSDVAEKGSLRTFLGDLSIYSGWRP